MKKLIALALVLAMLVTCMVACGGDKTNNTNNDNDADKGQIFIGATGPLTGGAASYGISVKNGAELAVAEINAAGGLNGIELKFDIKDDEADSEKAGTAYDALMDDGMQISIGSVTSGSCLAFADKANEDNLFFITPSASDATVVTNKYAFRICFGDPDQGVLAAKELVANFTNIGVIYDNSDPYSTGIYTAFTAEMANLNATFTVKEFDKDSNRDFSTQVEALKDCDVIFLPIYYTEAGLIAQEVKKVGSTAGIFGCDGLDGIAAQVEGKEIPTTIKYISPFDVNSTETKVANFVSAYEAKYGSKPDQFAADGYDAVYVLFEVMKKAGVNDSKIKAADLAEMVYAAITAEDFSFTGATGTMTWNEKGEPVKVPVIVDLSK